MHEKEYFDEDVRVFQNEEFVDSWHVIFEVVGTPSHSELLDCFIEKLNELYEEWAWDEHEEYIIHLPSIMRCRGCGLELPPEDVTNKIKGYTFLCADCDPDY